MNIPAHIAKYLPKCVILHEDNGAILIFCVLLGVNVIISADSSHDWLSCSSTAPIRSL